MSTENQDFEMNDNTNTNIQFEGEIVEYDENDFTDVMTHEAEVALDLQKKDDKTAADRSRQQFDSADYWMHRQQEEGQK
jgi:predicted Zn-dependent protease